MNQEEIKNKQKRVMIYVMIVSLICVVGVSYAFFTAGMSSETSTTVRADAGTMKITYSGGANINLAGIYPKDDVWATKTITVTGNNTTDAEMYYKLTLVVDSNTFKTDDPLQYELVSTNTSTNGEIIPNISKTDITGTSIELGSGHFVKANNAKHTYLLKIYYPKKTTSQNANQGAAFSAHVEITSAKAPTVSTLAQTILAKNEVKAPITTPGAAVSTASEALLASTEDDYGTSYYFRGEVKNNYVEFANKCWRIVRIGGDNTIKLILHNDNTSNTSNPCSSANSHTTAAFAHYNGDTYTSVFNSNYDDNAYVGFMYGTVDSSTYEATHANINKSTILTNLEIWYNDNLKTCESVIDDNVFCNDKSNVTDTSYDPMNAFNTSQITGLGYRTAGTYYAAYKRLYTNKTPSLKCNGTLSKITSKIGLITADELVYAGNVVVTSGSTSYLQENATGSHWWSMTPSDYYVDSMLPSPATEAQVLLIKDNCSVDRYKVNISNAVRPVISLIPSTAISGGSGTSEDPYVVN